MSTRRFISFVKLLALLLFVSFSVTAKTDMVTNEFPQKKVLFGKTEHSFHKNMLQPQVVHVTVATEHSIKPISPVYFGFLSNVNISLVPCSLGRTSSIFQDVDRCESVSRLLFPFHNFW